MVHSGKTMTFATDLVPQEDNIYSLGKDNLRWIIPSVRIANTYYGISFGRTTSTPVETILHTGIKWVSSTHMPVIHITGYAYGLHSPVEFKIGFYIYQDKIGYSGATNMGSWEPDIYLFKDTRNETNYVAVGLAGSCYYLQLSVDLQDEMGKFNNVVSTGWSWDFLTTTGTIPSADDGTTCIKVPYKASIFGAKYANITTTSNAIAYYTNTTGTFGSKASANGALYATSANGALQWGTLPIAQGGTGKTNAVDAWTALGGGASGKHDDSYFAKASHNHTASDINSGTLNTARLPDDVVKKRTGLSASTTETDLFSLIPGMYDHTSSGVDNALPTGYGTILNIAGSYYYGALIAAETNNSLYYRAYYYQDDEHEQWRGKWQTVAHTDAGTTKGNAKTPIYLNDKGEIQEGDVLKNLAYKDSLEASDIPNLSWNKITSDKPTTLSDYGITDAKIVSGVITLGSNTITPITSIADLTGSTITAANLRTNLGLSAALRFIGKATTDMSESTTTAPTVTGVTNYVPEVGDVVLDKNSDAEYVCIAKSGSTYTWELLGRSGSWATSTHKHGEITNGGLLNTASMAVVTDDSKKITTADLSVTDNNASTNATTTFVQAVTQNAQGKITVTKASLNTSGEWSGNATTATTATSLANNPSIQANANNANQVTITAGGKTSSPYTIPYATSAGSATTATYIKCTDTRNITLNPTDLTAAQGVRFDFKAKGTINLTATDSYAGVMSFRPYASNSDWSGGNAHQLAFNSEGLHWRNGGASWGNWCQILDSTNYTDYTVTQTGSGASGTWGISISGSATAANTATNLANNPSIQASASNANQVTITAGEKTSDAYTIPYATSAGGIVLTNGTLQSPNVNTQADTYKNKLVMIYCSGSMTQSPPSGNGYILSFGGWDNVNCGAQLYVGNTTDPRLEIRGASETEGTLTWGNWKPVSFEGHTHAVSLTEDTNVSPLTLGYDKNYKLTVGSSTCTFATPEPSTYLYAGADGATGHGARDEGQDIYLCLRENNAQQSAVRIHQGNNMAISSNANGVITFKASYSTVSKSAAGLCPQLPNETTTTKFLRQDGNWVVPSYIADTHHTAYLRAGVENGTANKATTTGSTYLLLVENNQHRSGVKLIPGSNMSITSDASGNVTFTSSYIDTKNTAGSTNSTDKLFLIGAASQDGNYQETKSNQYVFEDDGELSAKTLGINAGTTASKVTLQWNNSALEFVFT